MRLLYNNNNNNLFDQKNTFKTEYIICIICKKCYQSGDGKTLIAVVYII